MKQYIFRCRPLRWFRGSITSLGGWLGKGSRLLQYGVLPPLQW